MKIYYYFQYVSSFFKKYAQLYFLRCSKEADLLFARKYLIFNDIHRNITIAKILIVTKVFLFINRFRTANYSDPQNYQCCSGFYIDIFNILKDRLKFDFELYQVHDKTWGGRDPFTVMNNIIKFLHENNRIYIFSEQMEWSYC